MGKLPIKKINVQEFKLAFYSFSSYGNCFQPTSLGKDPTKQMAVLRWKRPAVSKP